MIINLKATLYLLILVLISGCSSCSQSGRRNSSRLDNQTFDNKLPIRSTGEKTTIKMEKIGGVFQIPVDVNGVKMFFIFDTGASIISISVTEANFLFKQRLLTEEDIKGNEKFVDANGDISEGTIILLKTVKIGDRVLNNVEASVVHNLTAPLLFGQSALSQFGKISIDNSRGEITFE